MENYNFEKWLESVRKQVSEQRIDLDELDLMCDKSQLYNFFPYVLDKITSKSLENKEARAHRKLEQKQPPKQHFYSIKKKPALQAATISKLSTMVDKDRKSQLDNINLTFKPTLNKKSLEIARSKGNHKNRIFLPKSPRSPEFFSYSSFEDYLKSSSSSLANDLCNTAYTMNSSTMKKKQIKYFTNEEAQMHIQKMLDWNDSRIERIQQNREKRRNDDLLECSFIPRTNSKASLIEVVKKKNKGIDDKRNGSSKFNSIEINSADNKEGSVRDLSAEEFDHALKRLHWELESISL